MARIKRSTTARRRHKKILSQAKGYRHGRKNLYRLAKQAVTRAGQQSYRDRRNKKRNFRRLWIIRINAACRINDISYREFIAGLKQAQIELDRKVLSEMAVQYPEQFAKLVGKVKSKSRPQA